MRRLRRRGDPMRRSRCSPPTPESGGGGGAVPAGHNACAEGKRRAPRQSPDRSRRAVCRSRCARLAVAGIHDPSRRMDLWRGGSPVRGILGWILSVVQARRVGCGDAPRVSQRAAARHRRPVLGQYALPRDGSTEGPSVRWALSTPTQAGCTTGRQQVAHDSASVAERAARGSRNREAHAPLWRCTGDAGPGACKHARG